MSKRTFITLCGLCLATAAAAAEPAPLFPFVLPWDDASPGITDLSGWLPKPAGKFGPVRVGPDGHLYTGGRRLRLNGVDLAFSAAFPTHDQADKVAARLAKFGNNIVRFHIMDMQRFPNGLLARREGHAAPSSPRRWTDSTTSPPSSSGVASTFTSVRSTTARSTPPTACRRRSSRWARPIRAGTWWGSSIPRRSNCRRSTIAPCCCTAIPTPGRRTPRTRRWRWSRSTTRTACSTPGWPGRSTSSRRYSGLELRGQWNEWLKGRYATTERLREAWSEGAQPLGGELLKNADFSHGQDGWTLELHQPAAATAKVTGDAPADLHGVRSVCVDVRKIGTESWHVRFEQFGLKLSAKQGYTATWWAKAEAPVGVAGQPGDG